MVARSVSRGGLTIAGKHVPEGVEAACNPWIVNRDKAVWGEDAEEFRPERWLSDGGDEDEERLKRYNRYLMTWGYGTRICLGRDLAMMELYKG